VTFVQRLFSIEFPKWYVLSIELKLENVFIAAGGSVSKSVEKAKRRTPSQVSNASRRSLDAARSPSV